MPFCFYFFYKQKTAYEMRIGDWSSDVCSSDLPLAEIFGLHAGRVDALDIDLLDAATINEVVHIGRAPGGADRGVDVADRHAQRTGRSEEHTSELQSLMRISYAVLCLKKKKNTRDIKKEKTNEQ